MCWDLDTDEVNACATKVAFNDPLDTVVPWGGRDWLYRPQPWWASHKLVVMNGSHIKVRLAVPRLLRRAGCNELTILSSAAAFSSGSEWPYIFVQLVALLAQPLGQAYPGCFGIERSIFLRESGRSSKHKRYR